MTFIDFCNGIGGGRLGLEACGYEVLYKLLNNLDFNKRLNYAQNLH
ncbi:hypothetical protein [Campylobacter upsaliensis]|nr:hypothetical protein [Campylobacter upsaliensis]EDP6883810.1 hypothetical protein [Campylobacter upsaliensis]EDP6910277.1 hypothetical protein [Campylobacter upsaliensis]MEB2811048.1 hypothetical protein [Campylobacter upsaliensis]